jgi:hypothetical protein
MIQPKVIKEVVVHVTVPADFATMQDWAGNMAQPLQRVAERAVQQYVDRLEDLYLGENPIHSKE